MNDMVKETYQLESACFHPMPRWSPLPLITISQRRMVLATTGIRPTEKMTMTAAVEYIRIGPRGDIGRTSFMTYFFAAY